MTTPKHRALQALADAKGRPFLAAAPLMAIVEAVAVLDEAGLLGRESDATLRSDIRAALANDEYDDNGEVVEAIRALLDAADPIDPDVPIPYRLAEPKRGPLRDDCPNNCDRGVIGVDGPGPDESRDYPCPHCEPQGETIRLLRDERGRLRSIALESLIQLYDLASTINDEHLGQSSQGLQYLYAAQGGFDALGVGDYFGARAEHCPSAPHAADTPTATAEPTTERPLCPKCSEPLFSDGTCMNFPACPNATIPF